MQIVPYLIFNGNCREAFSCYHQHLGGTLEAMLPFGDSPECGDIPADWKDKIMHAWSTASRTGSVRYAGPPPGESAAGPRSTVRESRSIDALLR